MIVDLTELPREAVYLVYDEAGKRVYVGYSVNLLGVFPRLCEELRLAGGTLQFAVLSVTTDIETLKLHTEYWWDKYLSMGCTELLPRGRKTLQYGVRCLVDGDYDGVDVVLVSARGDRKIVGKFKTMAEGKDFMETYYGADNSFHLPVYSSNSRTREYVKSLGMGNRIVTI